MILSKKQLVDKLIYYTIISEKQSNNFMKMRRSSIVDYISRNVPKDIISKIYDTECVNNIDINNKISTGFKEKNNINSIFDYEINKQKNKEQNIIYNNISRECREFIDNNKVNEILQIIEQVY